MAYNNDSNRRSVVSSFYGGRNASIDGDGSDYYPSRAPAGPPPGAGFANINPERVRADSSSAYFNHPQRPPRGIIDGHSPAPSYDRGSYYNQAPIRGGKDEEEDIALTGGTGQGLDEPFDIYADFNNAGPKYSNVFAKEPAYQPLPPQGPPSILSKIDETGSRTSSQPVELVTVPALGPEWTAEEIKNMTSKGRSEDKKEQRTKQWRQWKRDQRGCCGKWGTRKQLVIGGFILIIVVGIVLAFTIPRVPGFSFNGQQPLVNDTNAATPEFSRAPANFSFSALLDLEADTGSNYLPLHFNHLDASVFDLGTGMQVASGNIAGMTIPAKKITPIQMPLNFTYLGSNDTDTTWLDWYNACRNTQTYVNGTRPGVNIRLVLDMSIAGLIGTKTASTQINNVGCPFELSTSSV